MPLGLGSTPIGVTINVEDRDRNVGKCTFYFPPTMTVIDLVAAAAQAEAVVATLSNGNIIGGSISIPLIQSAAPSTPPEESDVERKGVLTFLTDNPASTAKIEIPSLDNAVVVDGTDVISSVSANALLTALVSLNAMNGVGFDLVSLKSAYKRHRRSSRG